MKWIIVNLFSPVSDANRVEQRASINIDDIIAISQVEHKVDSDGQLTSMLMTELKLKDYIGPVVCTDHFEAVIWAIRHVAVLSRQAGHHPYTIVEVDDWIVGDNNDDQGN
jgi:hypothetical protein